MLICLQEFEDEDEEDDDDEEEEDEDEDDEEDEEQEDRVQIQMLSKCKKKQDEILDIFFEVFVLFVIFDEDDIEIVVIIVDDGFFYLRVCNFIFLSFNVLEMINKFFFQFFEFCCEFFVCMFVEW